MTVVMHEFDEDRQTVKTVVYDAPDEYVIIPEVI